MDESQKQRIPQVLADVREFYVSDADEEFEPVVLEWRGEGWPSLAQFKSLILSSSTQESSLEVETLPSSSFDPRSQYTTVFNAVRTAADGSEAKAKKEGQPEIKVYRVQHEGARCEYWVLGLEKEGGRLVGLKARAVES